MTVTTILLLILYYVRVILYILVGGLFLGDAVRYVREKKYFRFGANTMLTIYMIVGLINLCMEGF